LSRITRTVTDRSRSSCSVSNWPPAEAPVNLVSMSHPLCHRLGSRRVLCPFSRRASSIAPSSRVPHHSIDSGSMPAPM
jgi:hypothetical protein